MTRDMSKKQFFDALKRYGFKKVMMWIDIGNGTSIGMIYNRQPFKPNYRASLGKAIREAGKAQQVS